jgi:hypothetical protein
VEISFCAVLLTADGDRWSSLCSSLREKAPGTNAICCFVGSNLVACHHDFHRKWSLVSCWCTFSSLLGLYPLCHFKWKTQNCHIVQTLSTFLMKHTTVHGFWTKLMYISRPGRSLKLHRDWPHFVQFNGIKSVPSNVHRAERQDYIFTWGFPICFGWTWLFHGIYICDMETALLSACSQDVHRCIKHQCGVKIKI